MPVLGWLLVGLEADRVEIIELGPLISGVSCLELIQASVDIMDRAPPIEDMALGSRQLLCLLGLPGCDSFPWSSSHGSASH